MITEFELGLSADITTVTRVLDDAGHTVNRRRTLVRVARLTVASRLLVLRPVHVHLL